MKDYEGNAEEKTTQQRTSREDEDIRISLLKKGTRNKAVQEQFI